jgi:hypothetical protein
MLESSQDLLRLVIAFVVLWLGIIISWTLIYVALMFRDIKAMTTSVRKKLDIVDQILEIVKKNVETTANYLPPLIEGVGKLASHFRTGTTSAKKKTKKK